MFIVLYPSPRLTTASPPILSPTVSSEPVDGQGSIDTTEKNVEYSTTDNSEIFFRRRLPKQVTDPLSTWGIAPYLYKYGYPPTTK